MSGHAVVNRVLDHLARVRLGAPGRTWPAFHFCGVIGWIAGISLALALTSRLGLSLEVTAVLAVAAFLTFLALALAVKICLGYESIPHYHHMIAVVAVSSLLLRLQGEPILPYLDSVFLGLGLFLACGRVGCFLVGCCHGCPHTWGVRYSPEHAKEGFTPPLVGVRLFPVQLVESLWVAATVALGTLMVLRRDPPGTALAWYIMAYGLGRFTFELLRGDRRPYWGTFSEPQWTSLLLMVVTSGAELGGILPWEPAHLAVTGVLSLGMAMATLRERPARRLLRGAHVAELAELVAGASAPVEEGHLHIGETSLGLRLSASTVRQEEAGLPLKVVASSFRHGALMDDDARRLAVLVARLRRHDGEAELLRGKNGVYHLLLPAVERSRAV